MKKYLLRNFALAALALAVGSGFATAADVSVPVFKAPPPVPLWNWTGGYLGTHSGAAMGLGDIADPLGPSIFGDKVHSPGPFGGVQAGFNWQAPNSSWVFGIEADARGCGPINGTNTCYAFSGTFTSFNCRVHTDAFGTATGRVGWAFGPFGRSLAYVKAGGAWEHGNVDIIINNNLAGIAGTSGTSFNAWGWTVGAGAEYALTAHWTVKAEYDYLEFGNIGVASPGVGITTTPAGGAPATAVFAVPGTSVSQQIHAFKLGVNYKFGPDDAPFPAGFAWPLAAAAVAAMPLKAPPMPSAPGWAFDGGMRYWISDGRFQKDIAPGNIGAQPTLNISRLTWDNLTGNSAEVFARVDTPWRVFLKGFFGAGTISSGKINDEDWGIGRLLRPSIPAIQIRRGMRPGGWLTLPSTQDSTFSRGPDTRSGTL